jgi:spore coat protein U-like protein
MGGGLRPIAVLLLASALPAGAGAQSGSVTINASVKATVVKPLQLTSKQGLEFGQVVLGGGTGSWTVAVSMAGVRTCPAPLVCTGIARPAILNVSGSNGSVVRITASPSDLVNAAGNRLRLTPIAPATVTLTNSGNPGRDFNVGGSLALTSATPDGTYSGTVQVTVDYQ